MNPGQHVFALLSTLYWVGYALYITIIGGLAYPALAMLGKKRIAQVIFDNLAWKLLSHLQPFLEKHGKIDIKWYGEKVPVRERAFVVSNHISLVDWLVIFALGVRKGRACSLRFFAKDSLKWLPGYGWALALNGSILLKRNVINYEEIRGRKDQASIERSFSNLRQNDLPLWICSFLEGTRLTPQKLAESQAYAAKNNMPQFKHVLTPRVKGFQGTMKAVRGHLIDVVYDVTIGYNGRIPSLWELAGAAGLADVHVHVARFPVDSLPKDDAGMAAWVHERYIEKEKMIAHLREHGCFPGPKINEPLIIEPCDLLAPRIRPKL